MVNQVISKKCLRAAIRDFIDFSDNKILFINVKPCSKYISVIDEELAEYVSRVRGKSVKTINFNEDMGYLYDEWLTVLTSVELDFVIVSNFNCFVKENDDEGKSKCLDFIKNLKDKFAGNKIVLIGAGILHDKCLPILENIGDVISYNSME